MTKQKVTVTLDREVVAEITRMSRQRKRNRSQIVEEALRLWERAQMHREMKEGYLALGRELGIAAEESQAAQARAAEDLWEWEE